MQGLPPDAPLPPPPPGPLPPLGGLPPLPGAIQGLGAPGVPPIGGTSGPPIYGMAAASPNGQAPVMHVTNSVVNVGQQRVSTQGAMFPGGTPPPGGLGGDVQNPLSGPLPTSGPGDINTPPPPGGGGVLPGIDNMPPLPATPPPPSPLPPPPPLDQPLPALASIAPGGPSGPTYSPQTGQYQP